MQPDRSPVNREAQTRIPSHPSSPTSPQAGYTRDEGRMSVSVDFGTTFSGISYGSSRIDHGVVQQILQWPGTSETFRKIPTCLVYDDSANLLAWGLEAKYTGHDPGAYRCEWCVRIQILSTPPSQSLRKPLNRFKLFLEPHVLRSPASADSRLPRLPVSLSEPAKEDSSANCFTARKTTH